MSSIYTNTIPDFGDGTVINTGSNNYSTPNDAPKVTFEDVKDWVGLGVPTISSLWGLFSGKPIYDNSSNNGNNNQPVVIKQDNTILYIVLAMMSLMFLYFITQKKNNG